MAQPPIPSYKVTDRRGTDKSPSYGASNYLYKAAWQTDQRQWVHDNNKGIHRNISSKGRQTLATLGTDLYANHPVIRSAINEMAYYSLGVWMPEYYGRNPAWGDLGEAWMYEHDKICNMDGGTMLDYRLNLVRGVFVSGDIATVYTETAGGYPKLQQIPGHRIRSGDMEGQTILGGQFDGATLIDGVLVDPYGAPDGYRVWTDKEYEDIPATGMMLHFIREYPGQLRGLSQLATAVFPFKDCAESQELELAAQKIVGSRGLNIWNEDGEADSAKQALLGPGTAFNADGSKANSWSEINDGVRNTYFRAGTGSKIEEIKSERPSVNGQNFKKQVMREALQGFGWNYDFALDPNQLGGVTGRISIEKINKTIAFVQDVIGRPASSRFDFFRISKAIKNGELPPDVDSWKFYYQGQARFTGDEKYSSDVAINEMRSGIKSPQEACAERGVNWENVQDQAIAYTKRLQEKCKAAGVDPQTIVWPTPNGPIPEPAPAKAAL
jgi:hypothetical protein